MLIGQEVEINRMTIMTQGYKTSTQFKKCEFKWID